MSELLHPLLMRRGWSFRLQHRMEASKSDIRSTGVRFCSGSVQAIPCPPARSSVFALFTSQSPVYPHAGHANTLSERVMSSFTYPQIHIFVEGKKRSMTMTLGFAISFLFSVPSAEFCTSLPKCPLCHPLMFSSCMTARSLPVTISWYT